MVGNLFALLYIGVFIAAGQMLARLVFAAERPQTRVFFGGVFALVMLIWLPALFSFLMGFTLLAQLLGAVLALSLGCCAYLLTKKHEMSRSPWDKALVCLVPFFVLGVALFYTHVLLPKDGAYYCGQSTWGDMPLHLGIITSLSRQQVFPPMYSILPGVPVGYPFLCDSVSATFYTLGASLRFAYILPSLLAYALVLMGIYLFFETWLKNQKTVVVAVVLFLLGGGFGFAFFANGLRESPENFSRIFSAFYETPTNYATQNVLWVNPIADMLVPQRATLFGWALLFPCLLLLVRGVFKEGGKHDFKVLGVLAGGLPLVHTHSFLALGIISAVYLAQKVMERDRLMLKRLLGYCVIALVLALPQLILFTFRQGGDFVRPHFNWVNSTDNFIWFYVKNLGLLFILLPVAVIGASKGERRICAGALLIWILCEFVLFQPNAYDNNKLLFVAFAFACGLIAKLLLKLYERLSTMKGRALLSGMVVLAMTLSGMLTLGREWVSQLEQFSADDISAAKFADDNTPTDAMFLTADNHNNAIAALAGRNIVCGSDVFLYFHGLYVGSRHDDVQRLYQHNGDFDALARKYGIDYVFIGEYEQSMYGTDQSQFFEYPIIYTKGTASIYAVSQRAIALAESGS